MTTNAGTVASFLHAHGLTDAQVAGVLGNFQVESGLNPKASNPREGAIGLAQWEGGRRTALRAYAAAHGGKETDLTMQLGYLWTELTGGESGALAALKKTSTPAQAASVWDQQFERSSGEARGQRVAAAQQFAQHMPAGSSWSSKALDALSWTTPAGLAGHAVGGASDAVAGGLIPSTSDVAASAQKVGVYLAAFTLGGVLLVLGLNKATGNPAGKVAGAASHIPIPL